jgi:hypothetical protein
MIDLSPHLTPQTLSTVAENHLHNLVLQASRSLTNLKEGASF